MASATQRGSGEPVTATVTSKNGGHLINTGQQLNVNVKNTSHPGGSIGIGTDRSNSFGSRVHHHHHLHHVHHVHYQEPYELSQDLVAKQLELLEKKYGGASKANEAALTITRAFRRYSMAKKFAHLTAQMKTEKRISRQLEASQLLTSAVPTSAASAAVVLTGRPAAVTLAATSSTSVSSSSPRISGLQRSSSSGSSSHSPHRHNFHSASCRHFSGGGGRGADRTDSPGVAALGHPVGIGSTLAASSQNKLSQHHHQRSSSQDTETGNDSSSSNSNQPDVPVGGHQSFPLDETSVYNFPHNQHNNHRCNNAQSAASAASAAVGGPQPSPPAANCLVAASVSNSSSETSRSGGHGLGSGVLDGQPGLPASPSTARSHRRMASAPHVPRRTVSRLTSNNSSSTENSNVNLNNNNSVKLHNSNQLQHQSSPSRRVLTGGQISGGLGGSAVTSATSITSTGTAPVSSSSNAVAAGSSGAYYLPDVDMRLTSKLPMQYRSVVPSTTSPLPAMVGSQDHLVSNMYTVNEVIRKRHYRTGLNIFNKKPDKGVSYLIQRGFLENSPAAVARFLITRKGLSKQMIGEYLGSINSPFNMAVLTCFAQEMDFSGMHIDTALRKFQTYFRMPGEAQKIERLVEVFSGRYCQCNREIIATLHSSDTVFILAFAIILLNTDLHTPNIKPEKRMKLDDFVRNLRAIDDGHDLDHEMLTGIYERIRSQEFRPGSDHVTQVMKVQQTIAAKCPNLAVPHRRLVCYCRLYEVLDRMKKERPGLHQREVFLFNDLLVITKIHSRKKNSVTYTFRQSYLLAGMVVSLFDTPFYPYGIQLAQKWDRKIVLTLNARNEHDRSKFVEDLKESIAEMDEMEALRLESELEKQRLSMADNRDSGLTEESSVTASDILMRSSSGVTGSAISSSSKSNGSAVVVMRKSAINNSLLDLTDASEKMARRGSVGSLDSGMSISFQSNSIFNNHQQCSQNNYRSPRVNGGPPKNNHNINH